MGGETQSNVCCVRHTNNKHHTLTSLKKRSDGRGGLGPLGRGGGAGGASAVVACSAAATGAGRGAPPGVDGRGTPRAAATRRRDARAQRRGRAGGECM